MCVVGDDRLYEYISGTHGLYAVINNIHGDILIYPTDNADSTVHIIRTDNRGCYYGSIIPL